MKLIISTLLHALLLAGIWQPDQMIVNCTVFVIWLFSFFSCTSALVILGGDDVLKIEMAQKVSRPLHIWSLLLGIALAASLVANGWFLTATFLLISRWLSSTAIKVARAALDDWQALHARPSHMEFK